MCVLKNLDLLNFRKAIRLITFEIQEFLSFDKSKGESNSFSFLFLLRFKTLFYFLTLGSGKTSQMLYCPECFYSPIAIGIEVFKLFLESPCL